MRDLTYVFFALVAVCTIASLSAAQQVESIRPPSTTPGFITKFTSRPPTVDDSIMSQVGSSTIEVKGNINLVSASSAYQIGGGNILVVSGTDNLFLGLGAGAHNSTGSGNTFSGVGAGAANTTGSNNSFVGAYSGFMNTTGASNTFVGYWAGAGNTLGNQNVFEGDHAGHANTTGSQNTFSGFDAGFHNTTGSSNTYLGGGAGNTNTTGSGNIAIGYTAGTKNQTGSNNIYIGTSLTNKDCTTNCNENNTIRIGQAQTEAFIAGVYNATVVSGVPVYVDAKGQLGTLSSSLRFKEQVRDMGDSSSDVMQLRPVTFVYKSEYDPGPRTRQYGLIAEEVAKVYPDLVTYDADGKPYAVKYQYLTTMLLNELQKQHRHLKMESDLMERQQGEIESLREVWQQRENEFDQRISRLETLVGTRPSPAQMKRPEQTVNVTQSSHNLQ